MVSLLYVDACYVTHAALNSVIFFQLVQLTAVCRLVNSTVAYFCGLL